jgi:hypothetical protein
MFEQGYYQPGKALYELKEKYTKEIEQDDPDGKKIPGPVRSNTYGYVLLGDPELNIWTDRASDMKVTVDDLYLGEGEAKITVKDYYSNEPVEGALVNIMNFEMYLQGYTDSTGVCRIPINPTSKDDIDVVVTAHNYLPFEDISQIETKPLDLALNASDIRLENPKALHGDSFRVIAYVHNEGGFALDVPVTVKFYLDDPASGGKQLGTDQIVSSISPGNFAKVSVVWDVTYRQNPYDIYVVVDPADEITEYSDDNNKAYITVEVFTSDLKVLDEDLAISPGDLIGEKQNITMDITIHNIGWVDVYNITVRLFDGNPIGSGIPIVTLNAQNVNVPVIYHNSTADARAVFKLAGGEHEVYVWVDYGNKTFEMDEWNNFASKTVTINHAPEFRELDDITDMVEDTNRLKAIDLQSFKTVSDQDNETSELRFSVEYVEYAEGLKVSIADNQYVNFYPGDNWSGTSEVILGVTDGLSRVTGSFFVTVGSRNDAPFIEVVPAKSVKAPEQLTFYINATDSDEGDLLTFEDNSDFIDINKYNGLINFTANETMVGDHSITITVSDGDLSSKITFTLKVLPRDNNAPVLDPINVKDGVVGEPFVILLKAFDPDADALTFNMDPPLFEIKSTGIDSAEIRFTPNSNDVMEQEVLIQVSDGQKTDEKKITIKIKSKSGDASNLGFAVGEILLWIGLAIVIIMIIIVLIFIFLRRKTQTDRDMKAWETMETDESRKGPKDEEVKIDVPKGERSVIEDELIGREGVKDGEAPVDSFAGYEEAPQVAPVQTTAGGLKPVKRKKLKKKKARKELPPSGENEQG